MKLFQSLLKVSIAISCIFLAFPPANAQSGNQSDITGPNPIEIIPSQQDPVQPTVDQDGTQGSGEQTQGQTEIDRSNYEFELQQANFSTAIQLQEEFQAVKFGDYLDIDLKGKLPSVDDIAEKLYEMWQLTGRKPVFIYLSAQSNQLEAFMILPKAPDVANSTSRLIASKENTIAQTQDFIVRRAVPEVSRDILLAMSRRFRSQVTNIRRQRSFLQPAQQLYEWIIAPLEKELEANEVDILVFSMDSGLRSLPFAAFYDGEQFLVEKYGMAIVPSFGLADISYTDMRQTSVIAMGASEFSDSEQNPLPAVPIELQNIVNRDWQGKSFLNQEFTLENFTRQNQQQQFGIIHLATHGEFQKGKLDNSYIQFFDQRLTMPQFRQIADELGWISAEVSPIELLVLSACRTALGDEGAELGFAGLAVEAGVKSALASLWYVSDLGTLALMSEFYQQLNQTPIKAEALQRTQSAMIKGEVRFDSGQLRLSNGELISLPPELAQQDDFVLSHPYFWSAFVLIGNWN